jgi:chromosome segregation ATPase
VEEQYLQSKEDLIQSHEDLLNLQTQYQGGCTREQYEKITSKVEHCQRLIEKLELDLESEKTTSDIASEQAKNLHSKLGQDTNEIDSLKNVIVQLQMKSDQNLIIGNLHSQIISLQKSEAKLLQQIEQLKTKCLRFEKTIVKVQIY